MTERGKRGVRDKEPIYDEDGQELRPLACTCYADRRRADGSVRPLSCPRCDGDAPAQLHYVDAGPGAAAGEATAQRLAEDDS